jgi:hypothetical protein
MVHAVTMDERTRRSLHAVAESLLAGPQLLRSGTIRLRVLQGGFGTVTEPTYRVAGTDLVTPEGRRVPLQGTHTEVAAAAGLSVSTPDIYTDHAELGADEPLQVDPAAASLLATWFERGRQALASTAPGEVPVLWPEHFDLAVTLQQVNYGVSAGDGYSAAPYAYVGPWSFGGAQSPFWNAPFGASRSIDELPTADAVARFFRNGREQAARLAASP